MNRLQFLEQRRQGIGGSDVAPILGISKWSTPLDVYLSKVDPVKDDDEIPEHMYWGNVLEPVIADEFQRRTGIKVVRRNNQYTDKKDPCMIVNIDRYCVGERAVLECKNSSAWNAEEWGDSGTDEVPDEYIVQCTHAMSVTGYHRCYLAMLLGGNQFRWYVIPWREKLAAHLRERCVSFWRDHVEARTPPPPTNADDLVTLYGAGGLYPIKATESIVDTCEQLKAVKEMEKNAKERRSELEFAIQSYMGEHDAITDPDTGQILATWKACTSRRIETKALKAVEPNIYAEYSNETTSRRFLLK